ncbi:MAG: hypothetical protein JNG89_10270 [Planctomycetaceae bacterium]|nr:hypothetical protein [Planctomycetaceae bacterium]
MTQAFRSLVQWYLGVEPAASGETARWSLAWGIRDVSRGWIVAALLAALLLIAVVALQEPGRLSRRWWRQLALRIAVLAVVAVWLGQLTLEIVHTGMPTLVMMIDTSASMGLEDRDPAGSDGGTATQGNRLSIAQRLLLNNDGALLRELSRRFSLHVYEFSETAQPLGLATDRPDVPALMQSLGGLSPSGTETRPGPCLDQVLQDFRGGVPAAAIVFSDGIASRTADERLSAALQPAALGVPVYTIPLGSGEPALDLEIYDLQVDPIVFVGDTAAIDFNARATGLHARDAQFILRREGAAAPLATTSAALPADGETLSVHLSLTPEVEGDFEIVITAEPVEGENNRENNVLRRRVQVRRDQIRALLVERAPRWEYRHLKSLLERDPNIELRTVLQESDLEHQREDRTALPGFPATRDDLFAYDVVILGDVDLQYLNPGALESLREFVRTRGGGLVLIAGDRHNPAAFRGTPLEPLIPVDLGQSGQLQSPTTPFHVAPARAGSDHPLLRLGAESRTAEFWQSLPPLNWSRDAVVLQPGGIVVATRGAAAESAPVIVLQRYGAGQVLFHATDELWRWRKRVEDRYYGRYWRQAVRFLCRAQRLGQAGDIELTTDRAVYRQGETVQFRLRFLDGTPASDTADSLALEVERRSGDRQPVPLTASPDVPDEFAGALPDVAAGEYHASLVLPPLVSESPGCDFSVELPHRELLRQAADVRDLQQAARASGGAAVSIDKVGQLPDLLPRGATTAVLSSEAIPLWARGEWLLLFVGLLATEWLLRRGP